MPTAEQATPRRRSARLSATPEPVSAVKLPKPKASMVLEEIDEETAPLKAKRAPSSRKMAAPELEVELDGAKSARLVMRKRLIFSRMRLGVLATLLPPLLILVGYLLPVALPIPPPGPHHWRDANNGISKGTYVDENALQPGQAHVYFDHDTDVKYADEVADNLVERGFPEGELAEGEDKASLDKSLLGPMNSQQKQYIIDTLSEIGLKPRIQQYSFTVGNPVSRVTEPVGKKSKRNASAKPHASELTLKDLALEGNNIFARFSSPRADAREVFVLAAPWLSSYDGTDPEDPEAVEGTVMGRKRVNVRGVATVLALARFLTTQSYLARDIIFLISDGHLAGMQAFLSDFYAANQTNLVTSTIRSSGARAKDASLNGGSIIWNALAIDYPSESFGAIEVLHEGLNGQLPNMDALNTVVKVAEYIHGVPVHLPGLGSANLIKKGVEAIRHYVRSAKDVLRDFSGSDIWSDRAEREYGDSAEKLLRQLGLHAAGRTAGIHGLFTRYHIDAVTIRAVPAKGPYGFWHMGRIAEGSIRAYNNLLERLHHSQFFYMLTTPNRFVPFGVYIPASILISVGLTFFALRSWTRLGEAAHERVSQVYQQHKAEITGGIQTSLESEDLPLERPPPEHLMLDFLRRAEARDEEGMSAAKIEHLRRSLNGQGRPVGLLLAVVGACHVISFLGLRLLARAEVECARDGFLTCKPIRTTSVLLIGSVLLLTFSVARLSPKASRKDVGPLLHSFAMLHAGMLIAVGSVLNFPQAYTTACFLGLPLAVMTRHRASTKLSALLACLAFIAMVPTVAITLLEQILLRSPFILSTGATSLRHLVDRLMWEWRVLRSAFIPYVMLGYLPIVLEALIAAALDLSS